MGHIPSADSTVTVTAQGRAGAPGAAGPRGDKGDRVSVMSWGGSQPALSLGGRSTHGCLYPICTPQC